MFFDSIDDLARVLTIGLLAYVGLVVVLRLSGNRTLAKMNAFDLVVTVALGSTLSTILLSADVSYAEGMLAVVVLVALQFVSAWGATRWGLVRELVKSDPVLLLYHGELIGNTLRRHRVSESEVRQAIRASGRGAVEDIAAVVLETDGTFSVIPSTTAGTASAIRPDVNVPQEPPRQ